MTDNPATHRLYRAKTLSELKVDLKQEIEWLNPTALKHLKNYQIWHHRQTMISQINDPTGEPDFIDLMLKSDSKNYHVWSYRQWLVKQFGLWKREEGQNELDWVDSMIGQDVRNNSAWNHRWFIVFGCVDDAFKNEAVVKREIEYVGLPKSQIDRRLLTRLNSYAKAAIRKAPQNQAPWNYLRGILRNANLPFSTVKDFALEFASLDNPDDIHSRHALDILADIFSEDENTKEKAKEALDLLATKFDPVRKPYWNYRKSLLDSAQATVEA